MQTRFKSQFDIDKHKSNQNFSLDKTFNCICRVIGTILFFTAWDLIAICASSDYDWYEVYADDAAASDNFGRSVALDASSSVAIAGVPLKENSVTGGANTGAAYIFEKFEVEYVGENNTALTNTSWIQTAKLEANVSDLSTNNYFGYSVDISQMGVLS